MVTVASSLTLLAPLLALLFTALSLPAHALSFSVQSVNCTQVDWSVALSQSEWSVAAYVELFFVSAQGAQNYSLMYGAFDGGNFPRPGTYSMVTNFGDTRLSGAYRIGVGLADTNGNIVTTSTSSSSGSVQVTAVDPTNFTFANCVATSTSSSASSTGAAAAVTTSSSATLSAAASSMLVTSTFPSTQLASSISTSTSAAAAAAATTSSSLSSASTSDLATTHTVNKGAIAGGIIGGILLLLIAFALVRWCTSRRRTRHLSQAANRMSALRPLELCEKVTLDGSSSPQSPQRGGRSYASRDTVETAALGRLSESSRLQCEYSRSGSRSDGVSLNNVLSELPVGEREARVAAAVNDQVAAHDPSPYIPLSRKSSAPYASLATEHVPAYPAQLHSRTKSAPLVINLPSPGTSPLTSPTASTFQSKSIRPSPSTSTFRIPRVSVPAYLADDDSERGPEESRQLSRSSSMKRVTSAGGATAVSVDEDPFVDAEQEQLDDVAGHTEKV